MKIDGFSMEFNYSSNKEIKSDKDGKEFSDFFGNKVENNTSNEKDKLDNKEQLLQLLFINLGVKESKVDTPKVQEVLGELNFEDLSNIKTFKNLTTFNKEILNEELESNLRENNIDKNFNITDNNSIFKKIKTFEEIFNVQSKHYYNEKPQDNTEDLNLVRDIEFQIEGKEHHNITNDTDLNILNRIAFSSASSGKGVENINIITVRNEYISEDLFKAIEYLDNKNIEELHVKMSPRGLGDLSIKLLKSEEETKFIITLSKKDIFNLISKNLDEIKNHLNNLEIKIDEISVEVNDNSSFSEDLNHEFNKKDSKEEKKNRINNKEVEEEKNKINYEDTNIDLLI